MKNPLDILKEKEKYLDTDLIESFKKDYDDLIKEKEEKIKSLKNDLKNSNYPPTTIIDLFEVLSHEQMYFLYRSEFG
jgi:nitrogen-specific signal transduction histidine kinase